MAAIEKLGGQLIVMASRALARVARAARPTTSGSTTASCARRSEPVILHWLGDMFDPALAGYWGSADTDAGDGHGARRHRRACRQGRRHQDLAARQGQGDRDAPPAAAGRAHVHRRRLQLCRADRRRRRRRAPTNTTATRCSASSTPSRRPPARRWRALAHGDRGALPRHPRRRRCRCRATSSRRRRASTRPAWCSWPGSTATRTTS